MGNSSDDLEKSHNQGQQDASEGRPNKCAVGVFDLTGEYNLHDDDSRDAYDQGYEHAESQSRVICTHFYRKGMLPQKVWRADMKFTAEHLSETTVRGYHFWAISYVSLMRKSPLAERVMYPVAKWRAEELAYQMGELPSSNVKGKLVRLIVEPICWLLGCVVGQKDWKMLYSRI